MHSNSTFVCLACRTSQRCQGAHRAGPKEPGVNGWVYDEIRCPLCRRAMLSIGFRWRIPKKRDDRGWKELLGRFGQREVLPGYDVRSNRNHYKKKFKRLYARLLRREQQEQHHD